MKLMTYLGLALVFSIPAKAIYVDGGIDCYPNSPAHVDAQAETILDYWDEWDGWAGASVSLQISGPSSAYGSGYAWNPYYWAEATASVANAPSGNYQYNAWHYGYNDYWGGWVWLYSYSTSCDIQTSGGGGGDPTPYITFVTPYTWDAGQGYAVSIYGGGFGTAPELNISGTGVSAYITNSSDTFISAQVSVSPNAPDGPAYVQVISHGYNGMGFQGPPGGGGPGSNTTTAQVQASQNCPVPAGETSTYIGPFQAVVNGIPGTLSSAYFRGNLQASAPSHNFVNRQVFEEVSQGAANACYYEGSGLPSTLLPGANASWTVSGFQDYSFDYIGLSNDFINYVQLQIALSIAPYTSCRAFDNPQVMKISGCNGSPNAPYDTHSIWLDIGVSSVFAGRDNASGSAR